MAEDQDEPYSVMPADPDKIIKRAEVAADMFKRAESPAFESAKEMGRQYRKYRRAESQKAGVSRSLGR
jgi:hypothetical protein